MNTLYEAILKLQRMYGIAQAQVLQMSTEAVIIGYTWTAEPSWMLPSVVQPYNYPIQVVK